MEYLNVPMGFIQDSSPHLVFGLLSIVQAPIALSNSSYDSKKQWTYLGETHHQM